MKKDFSNSVLKSQKPQYFTWTETTTVTLRIKQTPVPISHIRYRQNITQWLGPGPSGSSFQLIVRSFYNPQKYQFVYMPFVSVIITACLMQFKIKICVIFFCFLIKFFRLISFHLILLLYWKNPNTWLYELGLISNW